MADCIAAIVAAWMALPAWHLDRGETPEQRADLYRPVAEAVCRATPSRMERAFLATQAAEETHLARYVLEHRCEDGPIGVRCDEGRATGPWQVHGFCRGAWLDVPIVDRYTSGARCALQGWRYGLARWGTWAGGFQAQRGISRDVKPWARARARRMGDLLGRLGEVD